MEAYDELSQRDDMRHTWRVEAPKHAVTHTFLMHEILGFSAFHKAHKEPTQRAEYYSFGIHHQDQAIRGIREKLHSVTTHEAAAIVATSTLLTLSVFASTGFEAETANTATTQSAIDGILNIFNLMQGMGNVLALAQKTIMDSFLAPMFRDPVEATPSQPMLTELIQHIPTLVKFIEGKHDLPEQERQSYLEAIAQFKPVLQLAMPPRIDNRELRFLFFWPLHLQPTFLTYTRQRQPGALVVLMYYATLLFASEPRYWFLKGWGDRLMRACYEQVDQEWLSAIEWPASFLNQEASYDLFATLVQQRQEASHHLQAAYAPRPPVSIPHRQPPPGTFLPRPHNYNPSFDPQGYSPMVETDQKPIIRSQSNGTGEPGR